MKILRFLPSSLTATLAHRPGLAKIVRNVAWLFVDKIIRMGVGLLVGVWLARYLGPEQYGQFSFALALVGIFGTLAGLGLNGVVIRDIVRQPEGANTTLGSAFALRVTGSVLVVAMVLGAVAWLGSDDSITRTMVAILSLGLVLQSADVIKYWFESQVQSRYTVWIENGAFVVIAAIKVAMILHQASLIAFVWVTVAEAFLIAVGLAAIYNSYGGPLAAWTPSIDRARTLFRDSLPLLMTSLAITLYMRLDFLMLQELAGDREVGIYAAATKISDTFYFVPTVIVASVAPTIFACYGKDKALYIERLRTLYFYMVWLAIGISLPLSLFSGQIVGILYGKDFVEAGPVLAVHIWASVAVSLGLASSQYLLAEQLQRISLYRSLIGLACNALLNLMLIPGMGALGAALATVLSYSAATGSLVFFKATRRHATYLLLAPFGRNGH